MVALKIYLINAQLLQKYNIFMFILFYLPDHDSFECFLNGIHQDEDGTLFCF